ncbi:Hypothetical protein YqhV [Bacillus subtilis subsp. subtilis str. BSP1]|nr:Hypothetical protein YqhV [Bacillus subtilis subsp. subtilis str. BSP1]
MGGWESAMKFLLGNINSTVLTMAGLRVLSSMIELTAAIVMLVTNDVRKAVVVNSILAIVGPLIFYHYDDCRNLPNCRAAFVCKADSDFYGCCFDFGGCS